MSSNSLPASVNLTVNLEYEPVSFVSILGRIARWSAKQTPQDKKTARKAHIMVLEDLFFTKLASSLLPGHKHRKSYLKSYRFCICIAIKWDDFLSCAIIFYNISNHKLLKLFQ
jgi:hypothetical protein